MALPSVPSVVAFKGTLPLGDVRCAASSRS